MAKVSWKHWICINFTRCDALGHMTSSQRRRHSWQQINVSKSNYCKSWGMRFYKNRSCVLAKPKKVLLLFWKNCNMNAATVWQKTWLVGLRGECFTSSVDASLFHTSPVKASFTILLCLQIEPLVLDVCHSAHCIVSFVHLLTTKNPENSCFCGSQTTKSDSKTCIVRVIYKENVHLMTRQMRAALTPPLPASPPHKKC